MKQKLLFLLFGLAMFALITAGKNDGAAILKSSGSHISSTGAPGEKTCAQSECHDDAKIEHDDNKVVTTLIVGNNEKTYKPGTLYPTTLRATKAGIERFGFQIVALDTNNRSIGAFALPSGSKLVQLQKGPINNFDRNYVTHTALGNKAATPGQIEWHFNWSSSHSYQGKVTFYYCVNATNMDDNNTGDILYLASESISAATTSVEENESASNDFKVYPTIVNDYLTIENKSGFDNNTRYSIVSIGGMILMKDQVMSTATTVSIPLSSLSNGFYTVMITCKGISTIKQFVVVR